MITNQDLLGVPKDEATIYKVLVEERVRNNQIENLVFLTMSKEEAQNTGIGYSIANLDDISWACEVVPELCGTNILNVAEGKVKWVKKILGYDEICEELEYSEKWELIS